MTLITNKPIEKVFPQDEKVVINAYDISRALPMDIHYGADVQLSWDGNPRWLVEELNARGVYPTPARTTPKIGDTMVIVIEPIRRMVVLRLI